MNRKLQLAFGAIVALVLFALMGLTISNTAPWTQDPVPPAEGEQDSVTRANDQSAVVDALFGPQVIAFEVLGILLTAAMIGALVIARPLEAPDDDTHYSHPTKAQVAESDHASDPAAHALRNPPAPAPATKEAQP